MRRARALVVGLILALPWLGPAASGAAGATACAAETGAHGHAALVVDNGNRTTTYCVGLDADHVSGLHLIQLASAQYGLTYRLGFGGQGVCALDGVGPLSGDCFGQYPDFWGYWHGDGAGGWTWAGSGAGSASIGDGAVEGWSWGSGDSGTSHAPPPDQTLTDVCGTPPTPTPKPSPRPTHTPTPSHTPTPAATPSTGGGTSTAPSASPPPTASKRAGASPRTRATPTPTPSSAPSDGIVHLTEASGQVPSSGGPPAGAFVALAAVALLGTGGWLTVRRRRREERS